LIVPEIPVETIAMDARMAISAVALAQPSAGVARAKKTARWIE